MNIKTTYLYAKRKQAIYLLIQTFNVFRLFANSNFQCFLVLAHDDITCMVCGQKIDGTDVYDGICKDKDDAGVEVECSDEAGKSCMTSIMSKYLNNNELLNRSFQDNLNYWSKSEDKV